uniref:Uncharacterized protein n=1 Tax=Anoplophora glabripennis TaxID=217634 RepID=V5I888_ANOGL
MEQDKLRSLITKRGVLKSHITRFANFIAGFQENNRSITELKVRLEKIEVMWEDFINIQTEIEILDNSGSQLEEHEGFEENYFHVVCKARELVDNSSGNSFVRPVVQNSNVKLPIIPLPTFAGDYRDWPHFYDTFNALVNNNSQLNDVQRFHYLRDVLKGDAKQVIESIEISDNNYKVAFDLLKTRFDNKKLIKRAHVASLFDISPLNKESSQGLRKFLDDINKHLRALKNLGESVDTWDILLVYLISTKLDLTTKREWESYSAKFDEPKLSNLTQFLTDRCNILETLECSTSSSARLNKYNTKGSKINETRSFLLSNQNLKCSFCNGDHSVYNCQNLLKIPVKLRLDEIKKLKLCTNCLRPGHFNSGCRSKSCRICHKRHNSLLHISNSNETSGSQIKSENTSSQVNNSQVNNSETQIDSKPSCTNSNLCCISARNSKNEHSSTKLEAHVLLTSAMINICNNDGNYVQCRALLDNGSQSNFITKNLVTKLRLSKYKINIPVTGIGQVFTNVAERTKTTIRSLHNAYEKELSFLIINQITDDLPAESIERLNFEIPENITLADPNFNNSGEIDVLLGAEIFWELLCAGQIRISPKGPILHKSKLGWLISGTVYINKVNIRTHCNLALENLQSQIERFWTVEELNNYKELSMEEAECEKIFKNYTERNASGKFVVRLPTCDAIPNFENSRDIAEKRFYSLEKRFRQDPNLKKSYVEFMREFEELGHMCKIKNDSSDDSTLNKNAPIYYLPHHAVKKDSSLTTKLRVVFDASAKSESGLALNDVLLTGPTIQDDLFSILVRFRKHTFVIIADVLKMYRQILICNEQRDMQRIIWRESPDQSIQDYRLNTLTYGTSPASFIATRCLHELAYLNKSKYPKSSEIILKDFYMDDLITGSNSAEEAIKIKTEVSHILSSGGFELRK